MPETKRQQIISALDTRLKTITTNNNYETNAGNNVFEWLSRPLNDEEMPAIIYQDTEDSHIESFSFQRRQINIELTLVVAGSSAPADLRKLIGDVVKAIGTDRKWGGLAEKTIAGSETIQVEQESRRIAGAVVSFVTQYRTGLFDPYI